MNQPFALSSLSGVWLGRVYALHGELAWRLRWALTVTSDGRVTGTHQGLGGDGQRRTGAIQGFAEHASEGSARVTLGYRDEEGRVFLHRLELAFEGRRAWLRGIDELTSSEDDTMVAQLLEASRGLGPGQQVSGSSAGEQLEWYDAGRVELWRETAADAEHSLVKQAVRDGVRALVPPGARAKVSVVGTRRLGEGAPWEAYARVVYLPARAKKAREITARAEGATGRRAMKNLLASFIRKGKVAAPIPASPSRAASRDLLSRYESGDHSVWQYLLDHADDVLTHPDRRAEAEAVAGALMLRVRQNRDAVRAVLIESGANIAPDAPPAQAADLEAVVSLGGPLPIALGAFWRVVGGIALVPDRDTPYDYGRSTLERGGIRLLSLDPLWLAGASEVGPSLDSYRDEVECAAPDPAGPLMLELSPDFLHKQDISGGPPYAVRLPLAGARDAIDPTLEDERHATTLVGYLRIAFACGGFPLLMLAGLPPTDLDENDSLAFAHVKGSRAVAASRLLRRLTRDLVPF